MREKILEDLKQATKEEAIKNSRKNNRRREQY